MLLKKPGEAPWERAGRIQPGQLSGLGLPVEDEQVAAEAAFIGSTTASTALAAMAASTADPPAPGSAPRPRRQGLAGGGDPLLRDHHGAAVVAPLAGRGNRE